MAPAGCGKTELITKALKLNKEEKPILVLTHTNAGVAALRGRLSKLQIQRRTYRLATIDGWARRLALTFPSRSEYKEKLNLIKLDYQEIRKATRRLLKNNHITDILRANYSRILVDEYQDCLTSQHEIVFYASLHLPTCILGDPAQAIFGFGADKLAKWEEHVCRRFPLVAELNKPWRWKNADNEELGIWLLEKRQALLAGKAIDIAKAPRSVKWIKLNDDTSDQNKLVSAAYCSFRARGETLLVIGKSEQPKSRYEIAKRVSGLVTVEPVELEDLIVYARCLDQSNNSVVLKTLEFAKNLMTKVAIPKILGRLRSLKAKTAKKPATDIEEAALSLETNPSVQNIKTLLLKCSHQPETRVYRPEILQATMHALSICETSTNMSFEEAAIRVREEKRAIGRQLPKSAIGSTLLLKGLEADHVVVLNAANLNARNLYVAMTRGAKSVTLCSPTNILQPRK